MTRDTPDWRVFRPVSILSSLGISCYDIYKKVTQTGEYKTGLNIPLSGVSRVTIFIKGQLRLVSVETGLNIS